MSAAALGLRPSRLFALASQLQYPAGYWVRACDGDIVLGAVAGYGYRIGV